MSQRLGTKDVAAGPRAFDAGSGRSDHHSAHHKCLPNPDGTPRRGAQDRCPSPAYCANSCTSCGSSADSLGRCSGSPWYVAVTARRPRARNARSQVPALAGAEQLPPPSSRTSTMPVSGAPTVDTAEKVTATGWNRVDGSGWSV